MGKPVLKVVKNERSYKRVQVGLSGALCLADHEIRMVKTKNISEGGIYIFGDVTSATRPGEKVKLQLNGVVSGLYDNNNLDIYSMEVIHVSKRGIGLAFA